MKIVKIWFLPLFSLNFLIFSLIIQLANAQNIPTKPEPAKFVVDYADALYNVSALDKEKLENKLKKYADSTSTQIVIVIIKYLDGKTIVDYAQKLAETWGIGQKGKDNGILILVAYYEHQVRIHTGYGVEAKIPDLAAKGIIDNQLIPNFKANNYYQGLDEATNVIFKLLSGEFKASDIPRRRISDQEAFDLFFYIFMVAIFVGFMFGVVIMVILPDFTKVKKGWLGPTGIGNAALSLLPMLIIHIYLLYSYYAWEYWLWIVGTYIGMTLFMWLISSGTSGKSSSSYSSKKSWSSTSSYSDSSYSDSSSSYSDSYSDSSYGGGSFGGGGASGSW